MLTPVLPPTDESTWDSRVVGIWTSCIPLKVILETNPAISPITPPPKAIIESFLSIPFFKREFDIFEIVSMFF